MSDINNTDIKSTEEKITGDQKTPQNAELTTENTKVQEKESLKQEENQNSKITFGELFIANFVDIMTISALSFIVLFLFQLIIRFVGYRVADKITVYLIMFIGVSILYSPICNKTKLGTTLGNKLFYLTLEKDN
ncbi:hypothetical protein [Clostridium polynesiense]|uniref:hypothetical protein n=1 Tax=Clostridium polynesiense TaxID=1325933 RepID=UPI00058DAB21|nr:hypothetical protein [Clostridium polynesiense]